MKTFIFDTEIKDIPEKVNPAFGKDECLIISVFNRSVFKTAENRFILHHVVPSNEAFNLEKLQEVAIFKKLSIAKDVAILIATKENKHFIKF